MIKNQEHIFNVLKKNKKNDRLSHAYLFYGDEGVGKKEMAYALSCLFYCENDGCLECDTCKSILDDKHLNVEYIGTLESKKLISKEQITDLQEEFSKTSLVEGYRVYIVDGIDTASISAQNSLLKFIEEPINNTPTIGIFIARELANVVSTIVSRCALIHFPSIQITKLIEMLEDAEINSFDASLSALLTNNIDEALEVIKTEKYEFAKKMFMDFLEIKNAKQSVLFYLEYSSKLDVDIIKMFFKWLIAFYEDVFKIEDEEGLILKALYDKIITYTKGDYTQLKTRFSYLLELYSKLDYNVSAKNVFHELITNLF